MYKVEITNRFKKDLKLAQARGKNVEKLKKVVDILARGEKLEPRYRNHLLVGDYAGYWECHIEPDWLLVYKLDNQELVLVLSYTGSHSDLFD